MTFSIRPARHTDIGAMHDIRVAVRENPLGDLSDITSASYDPYVNAGAAWVAEKDNSVLGFAAVEEETATVWALFVSPTAERIGVGRALHQAILAWASAHDLPKLRLTTAAGTRAERFYRALGWQEAGRDDQGQIHFERSTK